MSGVDAALKLLGLAKDTKDAKDAVSDTVSLSRDGFDAKAKATINNFKKLPEDQRRALNKAAESLRDKMAAAKRDRRLEKTALAANIVGIAEFASSFCVALPPPANLVTVVTDIVMAHFGGKSASQKAAYAKSLTDPVELLVDTAQKLLVALISENLTYQQLLLTYNQFYALNESLSTDFEVTPEEQERIDLLNKTVLETIDAFHLKIASQSEGAPSPEINTYTPTMRINLEPFGDKPISFESLVDELTNARRYQAKDFSATARGEKLTKIAKALGAASGITAFIPGAQPVAMTAAIASGTVWCAAMARNFKLKYQEFKKDSLLQTAILYEAEQHKDNPAVKRLMTSISASSIDKKAKQNELAKLIKNLVVRSYINLPEGRKVSEFMTDFDVDCLMLMHVSANEAEIKAFKQKAVPKTSTPTIITRNPLQIMLSKSDDSTDVFNPVIIATRGIGPLVSRDFESRLDESLRKSRSESVLESIREYEESKDSLASEEKATHTPATSRWRDFVRTHVNESERARSASSVVYTAASTPHKIQVSPRSVAIRPTSTPEPRSITASTPFTTPSRVQRAAAVSRALAVKRAASELSMSPKTDDLTQFVSVDNTPSSTDGLVRPQALKPTAQSHQSWPSGFAPVIPVAIPPELKGATIEKVPTKPGEIFFQRAKMPATVFAKYAEKTPAPPAANSGPDKS